MIMWEEEGGREEREEDRGTTVHTALWKTVRILKSKQNLELGWIMEDS